MGKSCQELPATADDCAAEDVGCVVAYNEDADVLRCVLNSDAVAIDDRVSAKYRKKIK